jgi:hypothetical protein
MSALTPEEQETLAALCRKLGLKQPSPPAPLPEGEG